jgi:hypothetical protein
MLVALVACMKPDTAFGQLPSPDFTDFHTWSELRTVYNVNGSLRYDGDYGLRGLLTDRKWTLAFVRPSIRFMTKPWWSLHAGIGYFHNFFRDAPDLSEIRPFLAVRLIAPALSGWRFDVFTRGEWRMLYRRAKSKWEMRGRIRLQFQVTTPNYKIGSANDFFALAFLELFQDLDRDIEGYFGDRYRYNIGVGKRNLFGMRVAVNYFFHKIRLNQASGDLEADDHVLRLRLLYILN